MAFWNIFLTDCFGLFRFQPIFHTSFNYISRYLISCCTHWKLEAGFSPVRWSFFIFKLSNIKINHCGTIHVHILICYAYRDKIYSIIFLSKHFFFARKSLASNSFSCFSTILTDKSFVNYDDMMSFSHDLSCLCNI